MEKECEGTEGSSPSTFGYQPFRNGRPGHRNSLSREGSYSALPRKELMTVQELISKLSAFPNPNEEILVWVRAHTRAHSVAQVTPFEVDHSGIWISLPSHMHVVERKK